MPSDFDIVLPPGDVSMNATVYTSTVRYIDILQECAQPEWLPFEIVVAILEFRRSNPTAWYADKRTKYLDLRYDSRTGHGQFSSSSLDIDNPQVTYYMPTPDFRNRVVHANHMHIQLVRHEPLSHNETVLLARLQEMLRKQLDSKLNIQYDSTFVNLGFDEDDKDEFILSVQQEFNVAIKSIESQYFVGVGQVVAFLINKGVVANRRLR